MAPPLLLFLLTVLSGPWTLPVDTPGVRAAREHRERYGADVLAELAQLLHIPNVSGDLEGVRRNAAWIVERFSRRGVDLRAVARDGVPPVVVGRLDAPGAERTVGLYVHYDGQPVAPERWSSPPFEPTLRTGAIETGGVPCPWPAPGEAIDPEWRVYARGSGDDRAPLVALLAALDALDAADVERTTNVVFLFEGEEEIGSPHLGDYMEELREELVADVWFVLDGPVHQSRRAQLAFGVRGVCSLELTLYGAERPLHSGHYGNWAPNPAQELARLLTGMKDERGRVLVEGFYDDVRPLGAPERRALAALPAIDGALREELALTRTEGGDASLAQRLLLPSLNVRGLASADVGPRARNVIPAEATASIDLRLVPDCDPGRLLDRVEAHVQSQGYHIVRTPPDRATRLAHGPIARIVRHEGYRAVWTSFDHPWVAGLVAAAEQASGGEVVLLPSLGGSLPLYLFEEVLGAPVVIVPIANHDDNQHAADENLRLANLWYGVDLFAALLTSSGG